MQSHSLNLFSTAAASVLLGVLWTTTLWAGQRSTQRSQQEACMARLNHLSKSTVLYISDFDERYPSAMEYDPAQARYRWNEWHRFGPRLHDTGWTTQLFPYVADQEQYACPAAKRGVLAGTTGDGALISYTFNGHLHHYNAAGVANPAELIVLWEGLGDRGVLGYAVSQPVLKCAGKMAKGACLYVPGKSPSSFLFKPLGAVGVHEGRINVGHADTHVRSISVGKGDWGTGDPFTYDEHGNPTGFWSDGNHAWTFRPEYDFSGSGSPMTAPFQPVPVVK